MSTPKERPALGVLSVSKYFGTKSYFGAHALLFILEEGASQRNPLAPAQGVCAQILTYTDIWYQRQLFILEEGASQRSPLTPAQGLSARILTYTDIWYRG